MSTNYSTDVVVGYSFDDLVRTKRVPTTVTKYNENTGKPYPKKETVTKHTINDIEVGDYDFDDDGEGEFCEEFDLEFVSTTSYGDNGKFIGECVYSLDPSKWVDLEFAKDLCDQMIASTVFDKLKEKFNLDEPRMFLLSTVV